MKRNKLKLGLETIRVLTPEQLGSAAGGSSAWMCPTLVSCTCGVILTISVVKPPDTQRYCA